MSLSPPHAILEPRPSTLDRDTFVACYGDIFEHSPWVAEAAWQQGLTTQHDHPDGLASLMGQMLQKASSDEQIRVIRAHPDLAGKAALAGELTGDSTQEQACAGLDQCSPEELARFEHLNTTYKHKFAFPFVIAVRGLDRYAILEAFAERLDNDLATERRTAIEQVMRIARLRLQARASG